MQWVNHCKTLPLLCKRSDAEAMTLAMSKFLRNETLQSRYFFCPLMLIAFFLSSPLPWFVSSRTFYTTFLFVETRTGRLYCSIEASSRGTRDRYNPGVILYDPVDCMAAVLSHRDVSCRRHDAF